MTGYDLKRAFDTSVHHFWAADRSQLYRTLAALVDARLAEVEVVPQESYPDRKVHTAFDVEGIPKSFLFDRTGKLAGQTIDMRTESQFREMLKGVGLE